MIREGGKGFIQFGSEGACGKNAKVDAGREMEGGPPEASCRRRLLAHLCVSNTGLYLEALNTPAQRLTISPLFLLEGTDPAESWTVVGTTGFQN